MPGPEDEIFSPEDQSITDDLLNESEQYDFEDEDLSVGKDRVIDLEDY